MGTNFSEWAEEQKAAETPAHAELRRRFEVEFTRQMQDIVTGRSVEEQRAALEEGFAKNRIDLMEAVKQLGDYSARYMTWDEVRAGDIVLVSGGLAEVLAESAPDPEPEMVIRFVFRSPHNDHVYELPMIRGWLTAVVRKEG